MSEKTTRREMLTTLLAGGVGLGTMSVEEIVLAKHLAAAEPTNGSTNTPTTTAGTAEVDSVSSATRLNTNWSKFTDLKEKIPHAKLCGIPISRMFLGGNLMLGFAHARDLLYVSDLVRAYHTKQKIFATFKLAEACGINTFLMNPALCDVINEYWDKADGTLQFMTNCSGGTRQQLIANIDKTISAGGHSCLVQGEVADRLVRIGDFDTLRHAMDRIREDGLPAGIAAHRLETLQACVKEKIIPDYWMKTFHHHNYWSAQPGLPEHDNIYCRDPAETIAFMNDRPEPWVAFKVLAAGAIKPQDGFRYAFESGADFICVGMYDFQIVDDVNICTEILKNPLARKRTWVG